MLPKAHAPASNTDAVVALTKRQKLHGVIWSYSGGTPTGSLIVSDGTIRSKHTLTSATSNTFWYGGIRSRTGNDLTITLAAGGSGVTGEITVLYEDDDLLNL